jgi:predicted RNA-binding Zn-ribbon protein involved in translation (DUF1610 family)
VSDKAGVHRCPNCGDRLVKPAQEGGVIIRSRYVRIAQVEGGRDAVLVKCVGCEQELELREGRPLLFRARLGKVAETPAA